MVHCTSEMSGTLRQLMKICFGRLLPSIKKSKHSEEIEGMLDQMMENIFRLLHEQSSEKKDNIYVSVQMKSNEESLPNKRTAQEDVQASHSTPAAAGIQVADQLSAGLKSIELILKFLALQEIKKEASSTRDEWKSIAVAANRVCGFIIMIANLILMAWCIFIMIS